MNNNLIDTLQQVLADRWFQKDPTVVSFDNKLQYYFKTIDEVEAIPVVKDQECIRLHMGPLATSVKGRAQSMFKIYFLTGRDE